MELRIWFPEGLHISWNTAKGGTCAHWTVSISFHQINSYGSLYYHMLITLQNTFSVLMSRGLWLSSKSSRALQARKVKNHWYKQTNKQTKNKWTCLYEHKILSPRQIPRSGSNCPRKRGHTFGILVNNKKTYLPTPLLTLDLWILLFHTLGEHSCFHFLIFLITNKNEDLYSFFSNDFPFYYLRRIFIQKTEAWPQVLQIQRQIYKYIYLPHIVGIMGKNSHA